jgi:hypothetical protein
MGNEKEKPRVSALTRHAPKSMASAARASEGCSLRTVPPTTAASSSGGSARSATTDAATAAACRSSPVSAALTRALATALAAARRRFSAPSGPASPNSSAQTVRLVTSACRSFSAGPMGLAKGDGPSPSPANARAPRPAGVKALL